MNLKKSTLCLVLLTTLFHSTLLAQKNKAHRNSCINHLRILESAADQAAIEMNRNTGDLIQIDTLSEYISGGVEALQCPAGGRYHFGTVGKEPRCSIHGTVSDPNAKGTPAETRELWRREPENDAEIATDRLLREMSREQSGFDPSFLENAQKDDIRALSARLFPQGAAKPEWAQSRQEVEKRVGQLGADDFRERERATRQLKDARTPYRTHVTEGAQSTDPEVRQRARTILSSWKSRDEAWRHIDFAQYTEALRITLQAMKEAPLRNLLQQQAQLAQTAGPVNEGQKRLIDLCLSAPAPEKSGDN